MVNKDKLNFRKEKFELDKESLATKLMAEKGYFPVYYFIGVVVTALPLKEFKWTNNFIKEYHTKLDPKHKDMAYNYCRASISFAQGNYNETLNLLAKVNTEYSSLKMYVKILTLKAYYELNSCEPALSLIDSCKHFLRYDKQIPEDRRENYLKFIKFFGE